MSIVSRRSKDSHLPFVIYSMIKDNRTETLHILREDLLYGSQERPEIILYMCVNQ